MKKTEDGCPVFTNIDTDSKTHLGPGNVRRWYSNGSAGQSDRHSLDGAKNLRAMLNSGDDCQHEKSTEKSEGSIVALDLTCKASFCTMNVDSCGLVGGPDDVLGQAAVVTGIGQSNPLDVKAAVPPHRYILVRGHLEAAPDFRGSLIP